MASKSTATTGFWLLLGLFVIMYCLPWISNPGSSLTLGAYDLAEWSSLHPNVKTTTPPFLTCLLLRFPLMGLAWITGFNLKGFTNKPLLLIHGVVVVLVAVSLLPPLEFFTLAGDDPNYQQQFILAIAALIGGVIGLSGLLKSLHPMIMLATLFAVALASLLGLWQSYEFMLDFRIPSHIGIGGIGLISFCIILSLFLVLNLVKQTR